MKVGVCIFDDLDLASSGWASAAGQESVRIDSISELSTDTLWVTNLPFLKFRKLNLTKSPHIYDHQYFRTSLKLFEEEFGATTDPSALASIMSGLFTRTVALGEASIGLKLAKPDYRYTKSVATIVQKGALRARPRGTEGVILKDIWEQSTQQNQAMFNVFAPKKSSAFSFVIPRGAYFKWLLSQKFPCNTKWEPVKLRNDSSEVVFGVEDGQQIKGTDKVIAKLREMAKTDVAFFRVRVISMDPFYESFASFGAGTKTMRHYAVLPEIIRIAQYSKIAISDGYKSVSGELEITKDLELDNNEYSFSRGLVLENIAAAYGAPGMDGTYFSAINAYLHAYNRMVCGYFAEAFTEYNFVVGSYSNGRIMVYVKPGEEKEAAELALKMGLIPPSSLMKDIDEVVEFDPIVEIPPRLKSRIQNDYVYNIIRSKACEIDERNQLLMSMDEVALLPKAIRRTELEKIIIAAQ